MRLNFLFSGKCIDVLTMDGYIDVFIVDVAQLAGAIEYINCKFAEGQDTPNEFPRYDTKQSLGKSEYPFIVIAPSSTQARSGNTW